MATQSSLERLVAVEVKSKLAEKQQVISAFCWANNKAL